jgi:lysophospholipase L1-like esterase
MSQSVPPGVAVKLRVLGNSASAGNGLADQSQAWPWVIGREIEARIGEPVEVTHVSVVASGPRAADYALDKVEAVDPDMVVVVIGTYLCCIGTVSEAVRHRFGNRMHRWYLKTERRFDARTRTAPGISGGANRCGRSLLRKIIGTRPYATLDDVSTVFGEILRQLAQREGTTVVAFAEPSWPVATDAANPGAIPTWREVTRRAREVAADHHLLWAETDASYARVPDRDSLYQPDGVHKTAEGMQVQADALLEVLLQPAHAIVPPTSAPVVLRERAGAAGEI